jgi:hypothetical protein
MQHKTIRNNTYICNKKKLLILTIKAANACLFLGLEIGCAGADSCTGADGCVGCESSGTG